MLGFSRGKYGQADFGKPASFEQAGFGSANYGQANFGIGVKQGYVLSSSKTVVGFGCVATWQGWADERTNTYVDVYPVRMPGAFANFQGTTTIYASNILMTWDGNLDLGSGTATMYSAGKIAWDGQLVSDATWTTQTVE
ncbi:MAG: hypothetical protein HOE64_17245 [Nitrospina sp.]|nr:hypothetical protein [Nitrospina sp.]